MKAFKVLLLSLLLIAGLLSACGPSEEEQNATVTKIAAAANTTATESPGLVSFPFIVPP